MVEVRQVSKSFPTGGGGARNVLRDVSFDIHGGNVLCLLGPNGSGKTTLLKTMVGLLSPDSGEVLAGGVDVHRYTERAKREVGFASTEDQSFYGRLSGRMNLWFYARMYGLTSSGFQERLSDLSRLLDLAEGLDRPFRELSSGQKQRFLLARADLHDPRTLVLDEPHQNLDPRYSSRLRHVIQGVWAGERKKTVIVSTHHLEDAQKISDRWVVLSGGRVRFFGSLSEARSQAPQHDLETFFNNITEAPGEIGSIAPGGKVNPS